MHAYIPPCNTFLCTLPINKKEKKKDKEEKLKIFFSFPTVLGTPKMNECE
jgi:hypothetical protein